MSMYWGYLRIHQGQLSLVLVSNGLGNELSNGLGNELSNGLGNGLSLGGLGGQDAPSIPLWQYLLPRECSIHWALFYPVFKVENQAPFTKADTSDASWVCTDPNQFIPNTFS